VARSTKFEAFFGLINQKKYIEDKDITVMVKTLSFPGKTHDPIDLKFKGRSIPIKGQTKYTQTWECTFHLTENHALKNAFELWIEALDQRHNYPENLNDLASLQQQHADGYVSDIIIYQQNFDGDVNTAKYTLFNVFPLEVQAVQASYEAVGQTQEFSVTFSYSHYTLEVIKGAKNNFIDEYLSRTQDAAKSYVDQQLNSLGNSINTFVKDQVGNSAKSVDDWQSGLTLDYKKGSAAVNSRNKAKEAVTGGNEPTMTQSFTR
jgi:hypothetical protein